MEEKVADRRGRLQQYQKIPTPRTDLQKGQRENDYNLWIINLYLVLTLCLLRGVASKSNGQVRHIGRREFPDFKGERNPSGKGYPEMGKKLTRCFRYRECRFNPLQKGTNF